jgi:putative methionine-R-sulfoxide reductase with GAF domain
LAKQFGVSDEAIAGLRDPERHPFPPDQKAALHFADAMSRSAGQVPDPIFADLQRHYSEPQIVEIAAVIGLFNYFNRFNNALHMEITLADPEDVIRQVEETAREDPGVLDLCDRIVAILEQGRRYHRVGIYQRRGDRAVLLVHRGPEPPPRSVGLGEGHAGRAARTGATGVVESELIIPIRLDAEVVGVIAAERDREADFSEEDRDLLERVGVTLATFLATPVS